jgi:hypothetical protein
VDIFVGQKMRQRVIRRDNDVETVTVMDIGVSQIAYRKGNIRAAIARFVLGSRYLFNGEVGADSVYPCWLRAIA